MIGYIDYAGGNEALVLVWSEAEAERLWCERQMQVWHRTGEATKTEKRALAERQRQSRRRRQGAARSLVRKIGRAHAGRLLKEEAARRAHYRGDCVAELDAAQAIEPRTRGR